MKHHFTVDQTTTIITIIIIEEEHYQNAYKRIICEYCDF
jgi:hypothetical protein